MNSMAYSKSLLSVSLGALILCAIGLEGQNDKPNRPQVWGGQHIDLSLSKNGGNLTFDCATGRLLGPLVTDRKGRFSIRGTFTPEHAGPSRDDIDFTRKVTYTGTIRDETMNLDIEGDDTKEKIGSYTLVRGQNGRVAKCR